MASVLLVEDEVGILNSYAFVLNKKGLMVTPVDNAKDALAYVKTKQFDLILLDMLMPEMSGLDFLKAANLKATSPSTKVLVLSNTESPKVIEQAKALGADDYILKVENTPYDLAEKIAAMLGA